jgi:hypothetical protein
MKAFFTFDGAEREAINARRGDSHKLGLALHIGFLRMSGRLLYAFRVVPVGLWRHLSEELGIATPDVASLRTYCTKNEGTPTRTTFNGRVRWPGRSPCRCAEGLFGRLRKFSAVCA